jgi:hypothetical protein
MATPAEIISTAQCFNCNGATLFESMQISILGNILEASGGSMTQAEINAEAACFVCLGMSLAQAQVLVLLNAVAAATGGGGGSNNISGVGEPVGVVTPDAINQFYRDTDGTPSLWQSTGLTNLDWIQWN